jgi:uncharacterized protein YeaO (DUF488 family)
MSKQNEASRGKAAAVKDAVEEIRDLCETLQITEPTEPKDADEWIFEKCGKCSLMLGRIYYDRNIDELDTKAILERWKKKYAESEELKKEYHSEEAYIAFKKAEAEERWKKEYADSATLLKKFHSEAAYIAFMGKGYREYVPKAILSKADRDTKFYIKEINRRLDRVKSGKWDDKDVKSLKSLAEKLSGKSTIPQKEPKPAEGKDSGGKQQILDSNKADEQNIRQIVLSPEQIKILDHLNKMNEYQTLIMIDDAIRISRKTIAKEEKILFRNKLIEHQPGKKQRAGITQRGRDYLGSL